MGMFKRSDPRHPARQQASKRASSNDSSDDDSEAETSGSSTDGDVVAAPAAKHATKTAKSSKAISSSKAETAGKSSTAKASTSSRRSSIDNSGKNSKAQSSSLFKKPKKKYALEEDEDEQPPKKRSRKAEVARELQEEKQSTSRTKKSTSKTQDDATSARRGSSSSSTKPSTKASTRQRYTEPAAVIESDDDTVAVSIPKPAPGSNKRESPLKERESKRETTTTASRRSSAVKPALTSIASIAAPGASGSAPSSKVASPVSKKRRREEAVSSGSSAEENDTVVDDDDSDIEEIVTTIASVKPAKPRKSNTVSSVAESSRKTVKGGSSKPSRGKKAKVATSDSEAATPGEKDEEMQADSDASEDIVSQLVKPSPAIKASVAKITLSSAAGPTSASKRPRARPIVRADGPSSASRRSSSNKHQAPPPASSSSSGSDTDLEPAAVVSAVLAASKSRRSDTAKQSVSREMKKPTVEISRLSSVTAPIPSSSQISARALSSKHDEAATLRPEIITSGSSSNAGSASPPPPVVRESSRAKRQGIKPLSKPSVVIEMTNKRKPKAKAKEIPGFTPAFVGSSDDGLDDADLYPTESEEEAERQKKRGKKAKMGEIQGEDEDVYKPVAQASSKAKKGKERMVEPPIKRQRARPRKSETTLIQDDGDSDRAAHAKVTTALDAPIVQSMRKPLEPPVAVIPDRGSAPSLPEIATSSASETETPPQPLFTESSRNAKPVARPPESESASSEDAIPASTVVRTPKLTEISDIERLQAQIADLQKANAKLAAQAAATPSGSESGLAREPTPPPKVRSTKPAKIKGVRKSSAPVRRLSPPKPATESDSESSQQLEDVLEELHDFAALVPTSSALTDSDVLQEIRQKLGTTGTPGQAIVESSESEPEEPQGGKLVREQSVKRRRKKKKSKYHEPTVEDYEDANERQVKHRDKGKGRQVATAQSPMKQTDMPSTKRSKRAEVPPSETDSEKDELEDDIEPPENERKASPSTSQRSAQSHPQQGSPILDSGSPDRQSDTVLISTSKQTVSTIIEAETETVEPERMPDARSPSVPRPVVEITRKCRTPQRAPLPDPNESAPVEEISSSDAEAELARQRHRRKREERRRLAEGEEVGEVNAAHSSELPADPTGNDQPIVEEQGMAAEAKQLLAAVNGEAADIESVAKHHSSPTEIVVEQTDVRIEVIHETQDLPAEMGAVKAGSLEDQTVQGGHAHSRVEEQEEAVASTSGISGAEKARLHHDTQSSDAEDIPSAIEAVVEDFVANVTAAPPIASDESRSEGKSRSPTPAQTAPLEMDIDPGLEPEPEQELEPDLQHKAAAEQVLDELVRELSQDIPVPSLSADETSDGIPFVEESGNRSAVLARAQKPRPTSKQARKAAAVQPDIPVPGADEQDDEDYTLPPALSSRIEDEDDVRESEVNRGNRSILAAVDDDDEDEYEEEESQSQRSSRRSAGRRRSTREVHSTRSPEVKLEAGVSASASRPKRNPVKGVRKTSSMTGPSSSKRRDTYAKAGSPDKPAYFAAHKPRPRGIRKALDETYSDDDDDDTVTVAKSSTLPHPDAAYHAAARARDAEHRSGERDHATASATEEGREASYMEIDNLADMVSTGNAERADRGNQVYRERQFTESQVSEFDESIRRPDSKANGKRRAHSPSPFLQTAPRRGETSDLDDDITVAKSTTLQSTSPFKLAAGDSPEMAPIARRTFGRGSQGTKAPNRKPDATSLSSPTTKPSRRSRSRSKTPARSPQYAAETASGAQGMQRRKSRASLQIISNYIVTEPDEESALDDDVEITMLEEHEFLEFTMIEGSDLEDENEEEANVPNMSTAIQDASFAAPSQNRTLASNDARQSSLSDPTPSIFDEIREAVEASQSDHSAGDGGSVGPGRQTKQSQNKSVTVADETPAESPEPHVPTILNGTDASAAADDGDSDGPEEQTAKQTSGKILEVAETSSGGDTSASSEEMIGNDVDAEGDIEEDEQPFNPAILERWVAELTDTSNSNLIGPQGTDMLFNDQMKFAMDGPHPLLLAWALKSPSFYQHDKATFARYMKEEQIDTPRKLADYLKSLASNTFAIASHTRFMTDSDDEEVMRPVKTIRVPDAYRAFYRHVYELLKDDETGDCTIETAMAIWATVFAPYFAVGNDILDYIAEVDDFELRVTDELWMKALDFSVRYHLPRPGKPGLVGYSEEHEWPDILRDYAKWVKEGRPALTPARQDKEAEAEGAATGGDEMENVLPLESSELLDGEAEDEAAIGDAAATLEEPQSLAHDAPQPGLQDTYGTEMDTVVDQTAVSIETSIRSDNEAEGEAGNSDQSEAPATAGTELDMAITVDTEMTTAPSDVDVAAELPPEPVQHPVTDADAAIEAGTQAAMGSDVAPEITLSEARGAEAAAEMAEAVLEAVTDAMANVTDADAEADAEGEAEVAAVSQVAAEEGMEADADADADADIDAEAEAEVFADAEDQQMADVSGVAAPAAAEIDIVEEVSVIVERTEAPAADAEMHSGSAPLM